MIVILDDERCRGHGVCVALCPEVFNLTDGGYAEVLLNEVPTELEAAVQAASNACPERAITVN
jgi:ferredoxin